MIYVIRRQSNDLYFNEKYKAWQEELNKDCWLTKDDIRNFKQTYANELEEYLFYIVVNPKEKIYNGLAKEI